MKINLKLDTNKNKKEGFPLVLSIYVSKSDRLYRFSGFFATAEQWDFKKEEPKKNHPLYIGITNYILETKQKINDLLNSRVKMTAQQIFEFINGKDDDLYFFWEQRISEMKEAKQIGNAKFYEGYLKLFKNYKKTLKFSDIDYNFINKFKLNKKKTCSNNAINIYLKSIQAIYNEAVRRGVYVPNTYTNPFKGMKESSEPTKDKNLSIEEMKIIVKNKIEGRYSKYYDYFLLLFYLGGIDFIDLANLKKEHIRHGRIKFVRFKGGTNEIIDNKIFPEAEEILNKYDSESEYLLPIYNGEYLNVYRRFMANFRNYLLKIGITSYFTSKSARYTFINIGKELLLNREILMELTGHSRGDVHSIYEGRFSNQIKDEVHEKIIKAVFE